MILKEQDLKQISGGGFSLGLGALIGAGITFLIGLIDGYKPQCLHKRQYFITRI